MHVHSVSSLCLVAWSGFCRCGWGGIAQGKIKAREGRANQVALVGVGSGGFETLGRRGQDDGDAITF